MSDPNDTSLDNCGCCAPDPAPAPIDNRPGLTALAYRAGTYATFFRGMIDQLARYTLPDGDFAGQRPLLPLTTRDLDDPSIALLDASAVVADVLTFYQERIANEGFLRTAVERRSILELARAIGYELNPGVAASAYLAFTVEDAMGAPGLADVPAGTKVQSIPPQGGQPQTFETSNDLLTYAAWNALHPRLTYPQTIDPSTSEVYIQGTSTNLSVGDRLLLVDSGGDPVLVQALAVQAQPDQKRTLVTFINPASGPAVPAGPSTWGSVDITQQIPFSQANVAQYIRALNWYDSELNAFLSFNHWDVKQLQAFLADDRASNPAVSGSVYALRKSAGFFGNSAPAFASLPSGGSITVNYGRNWDKPGHLQVNYWDGSEWLWADQNMPSGNPLAGTPGAVTYDQGGTQHLYAFAQGTNGHLVVNYWDGSGWHWADQGAPVGTSMAGVPAVIAYPQGGKHRIYAFVRGANGRLLVNYWDGSSWHWADQGAPSGVTLTGSPAAVTIKEGSKQLIYTFVRGTNGRLYVNYWTGSSWHWADQEAPAGVAVAGTPNAIIYKESGSLRIYAFVRGSNGHLLVNYWNGSSWHWADQGAPTGTTMSNDPGVVTYSESGSQRIYAFVQGLDGRLLVNYWDGSGWHWSDQGTPSGTTAASAPSVVTYTESGNRLIFAFVQGQNGHLEVNWWDGSGWSWADQDLPSQTSVTGAPSVITYPESGGQRIYAFVQSANGWQIWKDQQAGDDSSDPALYDYPNADVYLERVIQGLVRDFGTDPRAWAAFETPGENAAFLIDSLVEKSLGAFAMSGKASGLRLKNPDGSAITRSPSFLVRNTTAYVQSEELSLVEVPMDEALESDPTKLSLDSLVLGLTVGQPVILTGERTDAPGVTASEVLFISEINHIGGFTRLTFKTGRQYDYTRSTLTINANVALATHGETTTELLGNGDASQPNQKFTLKKPPLTYTAAPTPSGSASTLQLRVNNLLWSEAPSLYELGPKDQDYIIRIDNDAKATVIFGDGQKGARLPTGVNNVVAVYRSGIGLAGEVDAGSLTILQSKPFGLHGVTNPLPASGAADPEKLADARSHAPLTVRTLDRIVSTDDYQDFASSFAGIGKAQAVDLWKDGLHLVYVTIAGADGNPVTDPGFINNFKSALDGVRDPAQVVQVGTFDQLLFDLSAGVAVDSRYISADVFTAVQSALAGAFSFASRSFGQGVTAAEVMTVIQQVPGVVFVDLNTLYLSSEGAALHQILTADSPYVDGTGTIQNAQLLLLNTLGVTLQEVKP